LFCFVLFSFSFLTFHFFSFHFFSKLNIALDQTAYFTGGRMGFDNRMQPGSVNITVQ